MLTRILRHWKGYAVYRAHSLSHIALCLRAFWLSLLLNNYCYALTMQFKNSDTKYGVIAKGLHWILALLIIGVWLSGVYMVELTNDAPNRSSFYMLHKSIGMCILMLVVIRLAWRLYNMRPRDPQIAKPLIWLAHSVHYALYAMMFIQPLSGWAMSSAYGYNPTLFGWFKFPSLVPKDPAMAKIYAQAHEISAWILCVLFIMHVGGALYHLLIVKDDTVKRML